MIILFVALVCLFILKYILAKFQDAISEKDVIRESRATLRLKTFAFLVKWLSSVAIVLVVVYLLLENFGLDVRPFLAGAGIVGIALGFGGQYLVRDVITGFFILMEGQYAINDVVKIGDYAGLVESVNLRYTRLRDLEGRVIYIPNGEIKSVINFTQDFSFAVLSIGIAYKENVDHAIEVIQNIGAELRRDPEFTQLIIDDLEMLGVDALADSAVIIKFRIKTLPIKQWTVMREMNRRIKNRFDELGIEIPFPHRTLYMGKDEVKKIFHRINKEKSRVDENLEPGGQELPAVD